MERAKTIKRIKNLNKIRGIVEVAKFDTIQKLAKTQKIKDHHYSMARTTGQIIEFANSKYHLSTIVAKRLKKNLKRRKLWVFITIPSLLIKVSYAHLEKMIGKEFDRAHDQIIVIGDPAIGFAKRKRYQIFAQYESLDDSSSKVSHLLNNSIYENRFDSIHIVANTPKIKVKPYQIYPIVSNKEDVKKYKQKFKEYKFYYSISETLKNISSTYVSNTIEGIYQETKRYFYQEKFAKHEGSIKSIDERVFALKQLLNKTDRKTKTEEMINITQILKGN